MDFLERRTTFKKFGLFFVAVIFVGAVIGGSYYLGFLKGTKQVKPIIIEDVKNINNQNVSDFNLFWEVWSLLKSKFVDASSTYDNQNLIYGAISGLVGALGDKYSVFFPPSDAINFTQEISGRFEGIGAEIGLNDQGQVIVIAPLKDTPAYKAGIKSGDIILQINGKSAFKLSVEEAVKLIRGPKGTTVTLTIIREGWKDPKDFSIQRDTIQIPTLDYKQFDKYGNESSKGEIAYIRLYNFYENSSLLFYQASLKAALSNVKGIIIDLRDNPGGYLEAAVNVASWFIEKGKNIVTEEFRDKSKNVVFVSKGPSIFSKTPLVVIINKGSASASEILAGALKENNKAIIVGEKSFGKGTVQELLPLSDGSSLLKLTVAHWVTPNGNIIDKNGIVPDIVVETPTSTATTTRSEFNNDFSQDIVFKKALEVINQKIQNN
jgi:carboxyl-terminal processing protease